MLRTRVIWTGVAGTPYYANFHWVGTTPSQALAAYTATEDFVQGAKGAATIPLSLTCEGAVAQINEANGELVGTATFSDITVAGTEAGQPLPYQVQALTKFLTDGFVAGRRVQGRSFFPGLAETFNSGGVGPIPEYRDIIENLYRTSLMESTIPLVVWSKPFAGTTGPNPRPARAGTIHPVLDVSTSPVWSTLRSRRAI